MTATPPTPPAPHLGEIVHYVQSDLTEKPAIVTAVFGPHFVNLIVFAEEVTYTQWDVPRHDPGPDADANPARPNTWHPAPAPAPEPQPAERFGFAALTTLRPPP